MTDARSDVSEKKFQPTRLQKAVLLVLTNLVFLVLLVYGFEFYLKLTDPFLNGLPFDTGHYEKFQKFYPSVEPAQRLTTWGHRAIQHDMGGRGQHTYLPKPEGACYIMLLGDSFTYGYGLAVEERYSDIIDANFASDYPEKMIYLVNQGRPGYSTADQREKLLEYIDVAEPALIIIGFVYNDTQPRSSRYSAERAAYYQENGAKIDQVADRLISLGLPEIALQYVQAADNYGYRAGLYPTWQEALQRTYETDSPEWQEFVTELQLIKEISDEYGMPDPVFFVLNSFIEHDEPTDYTDLDPSLPITLRWYHQAQMAAAEAGYRTLNVEKELLENVTPEEIPVNELDDHPSAKVNQIYAEKLYEFLLKDVDSGALCGGE